MSNEIRKKDARKRKDIQGWVALEEVRDRDIDGS